MIKTQGLTKRFDGLTAVDDLSIEVASGEIFGFLGPNGAGKTTTIRMLCALVAPTSGDAWVAGYKVGAENDKIRRNIGLLTESPGLYDRLSAWDNLAFYAELHDFAPATIRTKVGHTLEWLGLDAARTDPVAGYSKGMRQKLAIGRALLHDPRVLFLDEPTAGLDAESARLVRDALLSLRSSGRTLFITTHNFDEAERLCDRVAIFRQTLRGVGTPEEVRRTLAEIPPAPAKAKATLRSAPAAPKTHDSSVALSIRLQQPVPPALVADVQRLDCVLAADMTPIAGGARLVLRLRQPETDNPTVIRALVAAGAAILYVEELAPSLEEAYLRLTHESAVR